MNAVAISITRGRGPVTFVREGEKENIECSVYGSYPKSIIEWLRDDMKIYNADVKVRLQCALVN